MSLRLVATTQRAPTVGRATALLGDTPTITLIGDTAAPDVGCTVRLARHGDVWLGVVSDRSAFIDGVRMGLVPHFLFGDAHVVSVSGVARTRVLGRVGAVGGDVAGVVAGLLGPWGAGDGVVIEVAPEALVVDADDVVDVVPRT